MEQQDVFYNKAEFIETVHLREIILTKQFIPSLFG